MEEDLTDEMKIYNLAESLAIKAQDKLAEIDKDVNVHYLTSYFDEAIGNAIHHKQKGKS